MVRADMTSVVRSSRLLKAYAGTINKITVDGHKFTRTGA
jgi:hypothetical protein